MIINNPNVIIVYNSIYLKLEYQKLFHMHDQVGSYLIDMLEIPMFVFLVLSLFI